MADEHRPIQTSAVIVLGAHKAAAAAAEIPPPSPPTPCVSPLDSDGALAEPGGAFSLQQLAEERRGPPAARAAERRLARGLHVLQTEAAALANLARLYETDAVARDGFDRAVGAMTRRSAAGGKLVVVGVGKSGHIGRKLVATLQSLAIRSVFLHPTEALHGDLGIVGPRDTLLFISYSGRTHELLLLLPHLDEALPAIVVTSHTRPDTCELLRRRPRAVLLPAPIPEAEKATFGVSAPSTSTTVALALCDALAITVANELHRNVPAEFARNHPGGAIGAAAAAAAAAAPATAPAAAPARTVKHAAVPWADVAATAALSGESLGVDLLRAGYDSKTGWVRVEAGVAAPARIRQLSRADLGRPLRETAGVVVSRRDMVAMAADTTVRQAGDRVRAMGARSDAVIAVTEGGSVVGVLEAGQVLGE